MRDILISIRLTAPDEIVQRCIIRKRIRIHMHRSIPSPLIQLIN